MAAENNMFVQVKSVHGIPVADLDTADEDEHVYLGTVNKNAFISEKAAPLSLSSGRASVFLSFFVYM